MPECPSCGADLPADPDFSCGDCGYQLDPAPCCPDPGCAGNPCTFPGYAANH